MPKVLTQEGFKSYAGVLVTENTNKKIKITLSNKRNLICTEDHRLLMLDNAFVEAKNLNINDVFHNKLIVENIEYIDSDNFVYDLINVDAVNSYYTNGIISHNCILLDEFAFVQHNMAVDFFQSTYPVISSGNTTKVIIVSTPNGLNLFYKMWMDAIEGRSLYKPSEVHWSMVPGRDEKWKEETIRNTSEEQFRVEFEAEFIGSSATLIAGSKLRSLAFRNPISSDEGLDIYVNPIEGHTYIASIDCAEGVGYDYSTINIVDVTESPYKQVAKYRNNKLPLLFFPTVIYSIASRYNDAFVLVEINSIGQQVVDILHYDLEYENILKLEMHKQKGQTISAGYKKQHKLGVKTTKTVKKIGCANLKTLVESDRLIINDFDTIAELNTFVRIRDSYEADEGSNDDLVMSLVLFGWLTAQTYFKDATNLDIRQVLLQEQEFPYEDLTPVGIIDDGQREEVIIDGKDMWISNIMEPRKY